jgi:arsenate reductase
MNYTIYHNPRCGNSRKTLALLHEHNIDPTVILYLEEPLTRETILKIQEMLDIPLIDMIRTKESAFIEANVSKKSTDKELLEALERFPILLQRPIVIKKDIQAVIARPPEKVLSLLG